MREKVKLCFGLISIAFMFAACSGMLDTPYQKEHNKNLKESLSYRAEYCRTTNKTMDEMRMCMNRY